MTLRCPARLHGPLLGKRARCRELSQRTRRRNVEGGYQAPSATVEAVTPARGAVWRGASMHEVLATTNGRMRDCAGADIARSEARRKFFGTT